jgi:hypothetical protein
MTGEEASGEVALLKLIGGAAAITGPRVRLHCRHCGCIVLSQWAASGPSVLRQELACLLAGRSPGEEERRAAITAKTAVWRAKRRNGPLFVDSGRAP